MAGFDEVGRLEQVIGCDRLTEVMFGAEPGWIDERSFKDGDLPSLSKADQDLLRSARDRVSDVPDVGLLKGLLPAANGRRG